MSALLAYVEKNRLVMASDARVTGSDEESPKFQVLRTRRGPVFVGGVGWRAIIDRLVIPLQRICDEQGLTLTNLLEFVPGAIDFMLHRRRPEDIDEDRDIVAPPAQVLVAGFDAKAVRMRVSLFIKTGLGTGTTHELAEHDSVAVGFFTPEEDSSLLRLHRRLKTHGPSLAPKDIASVLGSQINEFAAKYPNQISRAGFFATADQHGLVQLPQPDFPMPWSIAERAVAAR